MGKDYNSGFPPEDMRHSIEENGHFERFRQSEQSQLDESAKDRKECGGSGSSVCFGRAYLVRRVKYKEPGSS